MSKYSLNEIMNFDDLPRKIVGMKVTDISVSYDDDGKNCSNFIVLYDKETGNEHVIMFDENGCTFYGADDPDVNDEEMFRLAEVLADYSVEDIEKIKEIAVGIKTAEENEKDVVFYFRQEATRR